LKVFLTEMLALDETTVGRATLSGWPIVNSRVPFDGQNPVRYIEE